MLQLTSVMSDFFNGIPCPLSQSHLVRIDKFLLAFKHAYSIKSGRDETIG